MASKPRFWWGRIESAEHAAMVTRRAAWGFGACAALILLPQAEGFDLSGVLFAGFIAGAAFLVHRLSSVWAARALALVLGLIAALLSALPAYWLIENEPIGYVILFAICALPFVIGFLAALRAHGAVVFLRRARRGEAGLFVK